MKMKMKRIAAIALSAVLTIAFAGCGSNDTGSDAASNAVTGSEAVSDAAGSATESKPMTDGERIISAA